jgi:2-polyprenyl-3-methyl-5-hydroxy-6-metoxy-1,4-benzoquinol methylase
MRKALVVRLDRRRFRWSTDFSMGVLGDLRRRDPQTLHRFLWSNHLAYAARYEVERKFDSHNINPTRHVLFRQILEYHKVRSLDPHEHVRSVFDVGCSLGYLLRHIEVSLFPSAAPLEGIDIDRHAVQAGMSYLQSVRSRVELFEADLSRTAEFMRGRQYDLVLCCGVLMYANEDTARSALQAMFAHCRRLVGVICLAYSPHRRARRNSEVRRSDGAYVHDMHRMIREAGGTPVSSTWVGTATSGSSPSYVILAERQAPPRHDPRVKLPLHEHLP